jgi:NAD(P)-dependent dehydrogenase (short-subunit alcohol dehydrogenase family)
VTDYARPALRVLVTGADQHQGLAVIRGLGQAGVTVIACGPTAQSVGFRSRYAARRHVCWRPGLLEGVEIGRELLLTALAVARRPLRLFSRRHGETERL